MSEEIVRKIYEASELMLKEDFEDFMFKKYPFIIIDYNVGKVSIMLECYRAGREFDINENPRIE